MVCPRSMSSFSILVNCSWLLVQSPKRPGGSGTFSTSCGVGNSGKVPNTGSPFLGGVFLPCPYLLSVPNVSGSRSSWQNHPLGGRDGCLDALGRVEQGGWQEALLMAFGFAFCVLFVSFSLFFVVVFNYILVFCFPHLMCMCMNTRVPQGQCRGQRLPVGVCSFLLPYVSQESGLAASTLAHRAILLAHIHLIFN